jgi:hypothetical protein
MAGFPLLTVGSFVLMDFILRMILVGCVAMFTACKPNKELPELTNGLQLQQDCVRLLQDFQRGPVVETHWPRSIRELKPMSVSREENKIRILLRREQGKYTVGYDVFADINMAPSTQGVWVQKTKFKGVWIFKLQY